MDKAWVTAPSTDDPSARAAGARPRRRASLRHRLILWLPQLGLLLVLAALAVGGSLQLASSDGHMAPGNASAVANQVYSVDQVRAGLAQDPSAWVDRTILVQGVLQGPLTFCGQVNPCPPETLALMNDGNMVLGSDQYLPVVQQASIAAPGLRYNDLAIYRVQLRATPDACALNPSILCYEGTILQ